MTIVDSFKNGRFLNLNELEEGEPIQKIGKIWNNEVPIPDLLKAILPIYN
jgi:hypothetical protein